MRTGEAFLFEMAEAMTLNWRQYLAGSQPACQRGVTATGGYLNAAWPAQRQQHALAWRFSSRGSQLSAALA